MEFYFTQPSDICWKVKIQKCGSFLSLLLCIMRNLDVVSGWSTFTEYTFSKLIYNTYSFLWWLLERISWRRFGGYALFHVLFQERDLDVVLFIQSTARIHWILFHIVKTCCGQTRVLCHSSSSQWSYVWTPQMFSETGNWKHFETVPDKDELHCKFSNANTKRQ